MQSLIAWIIFGEILAFHGHSGIGYWTQGPPEVKRILPLPSKNDSIQYLIKQNKQKLDWIDVIVNTVQTLVIRIRLAQPRYVTEESTKCSTRLWRMDKMDYTDHNIDIVNILSPSPITNHIHAATNLIHHPSKSPASNLGFDALSCRRISKRWKFRRHWNDLLKWG